MKHIEIVAIVVAIALAALWAGQTQTQTTTTTTTTVPDCNTLYWFDNSHRECGQDKFCGAYTYLGLRTFATLAECEQALVPATTTTASTTTTTQAQSGITVTSVSTTPEPAKVGRELTFRATVTDAKGDITVLYFCKEGTCTDKYFCYKTGTATPTGTELSCNDFKPTVTQLGNNSYWVVARQSGASSTIMGPYTFTVTYAY